MPQKIVISKPGYDALTETDPNNLIFSSDYNTLKYFTSGSITLDISVGDISLYDEVDIVQHGLDFNPFFQVFVKMDSWSVWQPVAYWTAGAGAYDKFYAYVVDPSDPTIGKRLMVRATGYRETADSFSVEFRYKIFRNNLNI